MSIIFTPFFSHKDVNVVIVLGSVGEEEPAVINVALFAVIDVGLFIGLRKFLLNLHWFYINGSAVDLTCMFLATCAKLFALNTVPLRQNTEECI